MRYQVPPEIQRLGLRSQNGPAEWDQNTPWQPKNLCQYEIPLTWPPLPRVPYLPEDDRPPRHPKVTAVDYASCGHVAEWAKGPESRCTEHALEGGWLRSLDAV